MSHAIINYPSDTNRMTRLVRPAGDLNGSGAALNASIQALTDAIAAAQTVLATLNTLATDPNLSSDGSGNIVVAGSASLDSGAILLGGGLTGGTPGDGSAYFLNGAMGVIPAPAGQGDFGTGQIVSGAGHSLALNFNSSYPQGFGNGFNCMFAAISVGSDGHFAVSNDSIANLLTGPGSYSYFLDAGPDGVSIANGSINLNSDGSASFASGAATIDGGGNVTAVTVDPTSPVDTSIGSVAWTMPFRGASYKKALFYLSGYMGSDTVTFPTAFTNVPQILPTAAVVYGPTVTTTGITFPGTPYTGWVIVEGF